MLKAYWKKNLKRRVEASALILLLVLTMAAGAQAQPSSMETAAQGKYAGAPGEMPGGQLTQGQVTQGQVTQEGVEEAQPPEPLEDLELYAKAAVLMDADSGRILYGKEEEERLPMASTTKIMTCIVALENGSLDDAVSVSSYAAGQPKVHLGMQKGQEFILRDLLYSLMLESHNDAAVAIAEHIGGARLNLPETTQRSSEESRQAVLAFAEMMNQKARDIGCFDSYFITPNGLDATAADGDGQERRHSTTARNLAAIMRYCAWQSPQKDEFLTITRTPSYSFADISGKRSYSCNNHNAFLTMMDGALTGKTGFTNAAGYCYVGALEQDGKCFTVALLACGWPNHKTWKWQDTKELMQYGLKHYENKSFETPEEVKGIRKLPVINGQTDRIDGQSSVPVRLVSEPFTMLLREDEEVKVEADINTRLTAPVAAGEEAGVITYSVGGKVWRTEYLVAEEAVEAIDFPWCIRMTMKKFLLKC